MKKPILVLSNVWSQDEFEAKESLAQSSYSGKTIRRFLAQVGITTGECYFTSVINQRVTLKDAVGLKRDAYPGLNPAHKGKYILAKFAPEIERLRLEISSIQPNIILALGEMPLSFLGSGKIGQNRGNLFESNITRSGGYIKALATHHPYDLVADWKLRPIMLADLAKVERHKDTSEFNRPSREVWVEPTIADLELFADRYLSDPNPPCGVDIETMRGTITEIGFAPRNDVAIVVPFYSRGQRDGNYWRSAEEELLAWAWVRKILSWLARPIFQNGLYDLNYLWKTTGITVPGADEDTMLLHHALQPEMKKGLGFLASIHTDEPSWKMMKKNETLKKEDE